MGVTITLFSINKHLQSIRRFISPALALSRSIIVTNPMYIITNMFSGEVTEIHNVEEVTSRICHAGKGYRVRVFGIRVLVRV